MFQYIHGHGDTHVRNTYTGKLAEQWPNLVVCTYADGSVALPICSWVRRENAIHCRT